MLPFSRHFSWLVEALRLNTAATPDSLSNVVQPTLDLLQRGYAYQEAPTFGSGSVNGPSASGRIAVVDFFSLPTDTPDWQAVTEVGVTLTGGGTLQCWLLLHNTLTGLSLVVSAVTLDASGLTTLSRAGSRQLLLGRGVTVPNGWNLSLNYENLAAGQTLSCSWMYRRVPRGVCAE